MPAGLVQYQYHMHGRSHPFTDESQMMIHVLGVDRGGQQGGRVTGDRVDRPEQVHPFILGLLDGRGT